MELVSFTGKLKVYENLLCYDFVGGGRFMADLLVTSLMADGGLEIALELSLSGNYAYKFYGFIYFFFYFFFFFFLLYYS